MVSTMSTLVTSESSNVFRSGLLSCVGVGGHEAASCGCNTSGLHVTKADR
jgi:hypothetical protein